MGRKKFSDLPPEVAARYRAEMSERFRQNWASGVYANRLNGALQADVQKRISESVKKRWEEGNYDNRINGMTGKFGSQAPSWRWGAHHYQEIYHQHWQTVCVHCGATDTPSNIHHIDEDHGNYLLSNLIDLCVPCHAWRYHYKQRKQPFITITKTFPFEYSHVLPWHPGKCGQLHGHSGHLTIGIRGRLDPNGVVEDYYDIGKLTRLVIIDRMDHRFLNDWLPNPTSEEFLIFAWLELELAGLKGLTTLEFSETESTTARLEKKDMIEAFGWDRDTSGKWFFIQKPTDQHCRDSSTGRASDCGSEGAGSSPVPTPT